MRGRRLTEADWNLIRMALNDAMDERESYAAAWHAGPERDRAMDWFNRYEALHVKLFGKPSARKVQSDEFAAMPSISIHELAAKDPHHAD